MNERRINYDNLNSATPTRLKTIAGHIQQLTYAEMTQLTGLLRQEFGDLPPFPEAKLLKLSEILLSKDIK